MNMAKVEINSEYLVQLQAEKEHLDSSLFVHTERLLAQGKPIITIFVSRKSLIYRSPTV